MKRLTAAIMFGLIAGLGLIWAIGCSSSISGPSGGNFYSLQLSLTRNSMHAFDASDTVICWVQDSQNNILGGHHLRFWKKSAAGQVAPTAALSDTVGTGTSPVVHYNYNAALSDSTIEWIYGALMTDDLQDTVMIDSVSLLLLP